MPRASGVELPELHHLCVRHVSWITVYRFKRAAAHIQVEIVHKDIRNDDLFLPLPLPPNHAYSLHLHES